MDHSSKSGGYQAPTIEDYGTLEELTADTSLLSPLGLGGTMAAVTGVLTTPGGGPGGGNSNVGLTNVPGGDVQPISDTGGDDTGNAGEGGGGGGGEGGGDSGGSGGGSGGGGAAGKLPFTGYPAAFAGAVGGVLAASGAALRRAVRPRR